MAIWLVGPPIGKDADERVSVSALEFGAEARHRLLQWFSRIAANRATVAEAVGQSTARKG